MMESLPTVKKDNLKMQINKKMPQIKENMSRITKILGMGTLSVASLIGSVFNPLFVIPFAVTGANAIDNVIHRKQKDIMFITRKNIKNKSLEIYQDPTRIDLMNKIKELNPAEKAGVMVLQTLVGFQRYQKEFSNNKEKLAMMPFKGRTDIQTYPQIFSTHTHGLNIKVLQALEDLGYINIENDGKDERKKLTLSKKIYKRYVLSRTNNIESIERYFDGRDRSFLTLEKLGFGSIQKGEVKENILDVMNGNIEKIEEKSKVMQTIKFQLTDKEINFDELYAMSNNSNEKLSRKEKSAIGRLGIVFNNKKGILKTTNIDIEKDKDGIDRIKYKTRSFGDRKEEETKAQNKKNEFREMYRNKISLEQQVQDIEIIKQKGEVAEKRDDNDVEQRSRIIKREGKSRKKKK